MLDLNLILCCSLLPLQYKSMSLKFTLKQFLLLNVLDFIQCTSYLKRFYKLMRTKDLISSENTVKVISSGDLKLTQIQTDNVMSLTKSIYRVLTNLRSRTSVVFHLRKKILVLCNNYKINSASSCKEVISNQLCKQRYNNKKKLAVYH